MTTATSAATASATAAAKVPLPLRPDTMLGVCEGLGEEFGFHPNWLRIALVLPFFFQPLLTSLAYLGLGLVLAFARWVAPDRVVADGPEAIEPPATEPCKEDEGETEYRIAA